MREILLDRLTDITYNQTLLDRILGCGDILLESPGRDSPEVFPDLPHPVKIQNEIYRLINQRRPGAWVAGTGDRRSLRSTQRRRHVRQCPGNAPGSALGGVVPCRGTPERSAFCRGVRDGCAGRPA